MVKEMVALDKNEASNPIEFPTRRNTIGSKWAFKKKLSAKSKMEKYKAQLVSKGYS